MGKKSRAKRHRRAARHPRPHIGIRLEMCSTCAFKDPTAYRDDPELRVKIRQALALESPFVCHEGFEQDEQGRYIIPRLPDGSEDKSRMKECRGISEALLRRYDLELKRESREAIP